MIILPITRTSSSLMGEAIEKTESLARSASSLSPVPSTTFTPVKFGGRAPPKKKEPEEATHTPQQLKALWKHPLTALRLSHLQTVKTGAEDLVPVDPQYTIGQLPNGMKYYLATNHTPKSEIVFRLAVKTGSTNEDEDQRGFAHICEHLAFRATRDFQNFSLIKQLESIGSSFGAHQNAYTSFDETVYILKVPSDKEEILELGFQVMANIAYYIRASDEDMDAERPIVWEEWRGKQGAAMRCTESMLGCLVKDSLYAHRLPIGVEETVKNTPAARARDYIKKWYKPEAMALVVVGDVPSKKPLKALMEKWFISEGPPIVNPMEPANRDALCYPGNKIGKEVPRHKETRYSLQTDPEQTTSSAQICIKHWFEDMLSYHTVGHQKMMMTGAMFNIAMNTRLQRMLYQENPPFLSASVEYGPAGMGNILQTGIEIANKEGELPSALAAAVREVHRARLHGFSDREVASIKDQLGTMLQSSFMERHNKDSASMADSAVQHFIGMENLCSEEYEYRLLQVVIEAITSEEIQAIGKMFIMGENTMVSFVEPEKEGLKPVTQEEASKLLLAAQEGDLDLWAESELKSSLIEDEALLPPGSIVSCRSLPIKVDGEPIECAVADIGSLALPAGSKGGKDGHIIELKLSNGLTVNLQQTAFKSDSVEMQASALIGNSGVPDEMQHSAEAADLYAGLIGQFGFPPMDLNEMLSSHAVSTHPSIGNHSTNLTSSFSPKDAEIAFQMAYILFTKGKDFEHSESAKTMVVDMLREQIQNKDRDPKSSYSQKLKETITDNNPRFNSIKLDDLPKLDFDFMRNHFCKHFSDVSKFEFFFIGNIDLEAYVPLIEKYLASLPVPTESIGEVSVKAHPIGFPSGVTKAEVRQGNAPKSDVLIAFPSMMSSTDLDWRTIDCPENGTYVDMACQVLNMHLTDKLRFELSGAYSPGSGPLSVQAPPRLWTEAPLERPVTMIINFGCDPDRVEALSAGAIGVMETIATKGPDAEKVDAVRKVVEESIKIEQQSNSFWLIMMIHASHALGKTPAKHKGEWVAVANQTADEQVQSFSTEICRDTMGKFYKADHYALVTLYPEGEH